MKPEGEPLAPEDLDNTMSLTTYANPRVPRFWRVRAAGAFLGLCRHPADCQAEKLSLFVRGQRLTITDSSGRVSEVTITGFVDQYRSVWRRLADFARRIFR